LHGSGELQKRTNGGTTRQAVQLFPVGKKSSLDYTRSRRLGDQKTITSTRRPAGLVKCSRVKSIQETSTIQGNYHMTAKETLIKMIKSMPEKTSVPEILAELYLRGKINGGPPLPSGIAERLQDDFLREANVVIPIRLPKSQRGKAWRAMIEIGPVRLVAKDPIYEVTPAHLALLKASGFSYEIVTRDAKRKGNHRRGTSR
jgi:hypothetical protein